MNRPEVRPWSRFVLAIALVDGDERGKVEGLMEHEKGRIWVQAWHTCARRMLCLYSPVNNMCTVKVLVTL